MTLRIPRKQYADLYGPTTGDRIRLADTDLFIEIERDLTVYGEEAKFGGGKVLRDGMGQSARATSADEALDLVDHRTRSSWIIGESSRPISAFAADGSSAIGKAGNPD